MFVYEEYTEKPGCRPRLLSKCCCLRDLPLDVTGAQAAPITTATERALQVRETRVTAIIRCHPTPDRSEIPQPLHTPHPAIHET